MFLIVNKARYMVYQRETPEAVALFLWGCDRKRYLIIFKDEVVNIDDCEDITDIEKKLKRLIHDHRTRNHEHRQLEAVHSVSQG